MTVSTPVVRPPRPRRARRIAVLLEVVVGVVVLGVAAMVPTLPARAHFQTIAFSNVAVAGDQVTWDLYLDPYHVRALVELDDDGDGTISAEEVAANDASLRELGREAIRVSRAGTAVEPTIDRIAMVTAGGLVLPEQWRPTDAFPLIHVAARFVLPSGDGDPRLEYPLLERGDVDQHQNITVASTAGTEYLHVFDPDTTGLTIDAQLAPPRSGLVPGLWAVAGGTALGGAVVAGIRRRSRSRHTGNTSSGGHGGFGATEPS